jgi:uncharacterized membrane protein
MASEDRQITTGIGWSGTLLVVLAGLYPALHREFWAVPLTMAAVGIAYGVWKCVRLLAMIFNNLHWRDVESPADDE